MITCLAETACSMELCRSNRPIEMRPRPMTNPAPDTSVLQNAPAHADEPEHHHRPPASGRYLALLSLTALGIAYGDIGTSPLYAIRESFHGPHAIPTTPTNVMGVLSLIFWSLI